MPRDRPTPPPFEPDALERSLDRYLICGPRLHGRAHRRVRRLPGAGAHPAGRRRDRAADAPTATSARQLFATQLLRRATARTASGGSAPVLELARSSSRAPPMPRSSNLIAGRRVRHGDAGMEPGLRRHPDRRADRPDHHLSPLARTERPERAHLAPGRPPAYPHHGGRDGLLNRNGRTSRWTAPTTASASALNSALMSWPLFQYQRRPRPHKRTPSGAEYTRRWLTRRGLRID